MKPLAVDDLRYLSAPQDDPNVARAIESEDLSIAQETNSSDANINFAEVNRLEPRGVFILDSSGRIRGYDSAAAAWMVEAVRKDAAEPRHIADLTPDGGLDGILRRLFAGEAVESTIATLFSGATKVDAACHWTLITGELGPHAVLTIGLPQNRPHATALDSLTQLPDRREIPVRVDQWRRAATPASPRFSVLFVDLDDFKTVNDRYGHATGDAVLRAFAQRLAHSIRDGDLAARYGGDEFVVLIRDAVSSDEIEPVLARLAVSLRQPVNAGNVTLHLNATIGWAATHGDGWTTESLIAAADADMYARKRAMVRCENDGSAAGAV